MILTVIDFWKSCEFSIRDVIVMSVCYYVDILVIKNDKFFENEM